MEFRIEPKPNTPWKPGSPNLQRHSMDNNVRNSWPLEDNSPPPPLPPRGILKAYIK